MGQDVKGRLDYEDFVQAVGKNRVFGGYVTPGTGVTVNVAAVLGTVAGNDVENAGATGLALTAGAAAGQTVCNAVVMNTSGTLSVIAGTSAATGSQVAPTIDETQYALLATVNVANGAASVTQASINNTVRRWL